MHYLQLFFRHRDRPLLIPVSEATCEGFGEQFEDLETELEMLHFPSYYGHDVRVSAKRLQFVQCLLEMDLPQFGTAQLKPSFFDADDYIEHMNEAPQNVGLVIWFAGRDEPLKCGVGSHDFAGIDTAMSCEHAYFSVTDDDGEGLVVRLKDVDCLVMTDGERYGDELESRALAMPTQWGDTR